MRLHAGLPDHALHGRGLAPSWVLISKIREEYPDRMLTFSVVPHNRPPMWFCLPFTLALRGPVAYKGPVLYGVHGR